MVQKENIQHVIDTARRVIVDLKVAMHSADKIDERKLDELRNIVIEAQMQSCTLLGRSINNR